MTTKNIEIKELRRTDISMFYSMLNKEFFGSQEINDLSRFETHLDTRTKSFGFYDGDELKGGAYVRITNEDCYSSIAFQRRSVHPNTTQDIVTQLTNYLFKTFPIRMIYGHISVKNIACLKLLKKAGWFISDFVQKSDGWYAVAGIIREKQIESNNEMCHSL